MFAFMVLASVAVQPVPRIETADDRLGLFKTNRVNFERALIDDAKLALKNNKIGEVAEAVSKLGLMRSTEAVDFLVENITFAVAPPLPRGVFVFNAPLIDQHPCATALAAIGVPAFPKLMQLAETSDDEGKLHRVAAVMRECLGEKQAVAYVKCHLQGVKDKAAHARVTKMLEAVPSF